MPSSSEHARHPLRLQVVQLRPLKRRADRTLSRIRAAIADAGKTGVDLIVFPETAVTGYFLEGGVSEASLTSAQLAEGLGSPPPQAPDVVIGFYERGRGAIHNSGAYLTAGSDGWQLVHCHRKVFLPTYGVFDEARYITPGNRFRAFDTRFGRIGLLVCEDMHHSMAPAILALDGAELLVCLSATPARDYRPGTGLPGNLERWDSTGRAIALEHSLPLVVAHLTGSEGGRIFAGGSVAYGPGGEILARGPLFEEGTLAVSIDWSATHRQRIASPMLRDLRTMWPHMEREGSRAAGQTPSEPGLAAEGLPLPVEATVDPDDAGFLDLDPDLLTTALISFLRDEVQGRRGFERVVLGLSGGVDSAVTLLLAVRAFGSEHVTALLLPYATSSPESLTDAKAVARVAGVETRTIPISPGIDAYIESEEQDITALRRGNLAARFRSLVIWDQSARLGALPLGTGNKSERLLGYYTWHADDAPPVNPLGDLYKTQVLALARHLGVPDEILSKPPSADLVEGVHDEDELDVTYAFADRILHWLLKGVAPETLIASGFAEGDVRTVHRRLEGTHWKRQLPTSAMVSDSAIGAFYLRPVDY